MSKGIRLLSVLAAALATPAFGVSAAAAPRAAAVTALVVTDVRDSAQRTMPAALWRKLAADGVRARIVAAEDGTALPDDARCRSAHAAYAVLATFERAMRLPGLAQDTDRVYGIVRYTVRNCVTGAVAATKIVRIESEPLSETDRVDEPTVERAWERAIRITLARDPLVVTAGGTPTPSPAPRR